MTYLKKKEWQWNLETVVAKHYFYQDCIANSFFSQNATDDSEGNTGNTLLLCKLVIVLNFISWYLNHFSVTDAQNR